MKWRRMLKSILIEIPLADQIVLGMYYVVMLDYDNFSKYIIDESGIYPALHKYWLIASQKFMLQCSETITNKSLELRVTRQKLHL